MDAHDEGIVVGLLAGEGHFGGDGRQAQVTLRMHVRHEKLFRWLAGAFPSKAGCTGRTTTAAATTSSGWRAGRRSSATCFPLLERHITPELDSHAYERLTAMTVSYAEAIARLRARAALSSS